MQGNCRLPIADCRLRPLSGWFAAALVVAGCSSARQGQGPIDNPRLQRRAEECLKAAIRYAPSPAVRVEAVEALQHVGRDELPWIRSALLDDHPAVRFAACLAIGQVADSGAQTGIQRCLDDPDASVRVAALFARHRLGHTERTGEIAGYLLEHSDAAVRRNAALVLGLMDERSATKILAKAMKDPDRGVRDHALEAMARLGNPEARQELAFMTNAGHGSEEVFALTALAATRDPAFLDTFRYKLANAPHVETRLAAARGLGFLGDDAGLKIALQALRSPPPSAASNADSADEPALRIRQLAAGALGAIGRTQALPALEQLMEKSPDPRVQVSAAWAILEIADPKRRERGPFASSKDKRKR